MTLVDARRGLAVAAALGSMAVLGLCVAAPAAAAKMNSDELLEFCRTSGGIFVDAPYAYSCTLPSGTFINCEANTDKECDVTAPPGASDPIPGVTPKPEDNAPDEPGPVPPGPIVKPNAGNAG